jgi:hypothetical protein
LQGPSTPAAQPVPPTPLPVATLPTGRIQPLFTGLSNAPQTAPQPAPVQPAPVQPAPVQPTPKQPAQQKAALPTPQKARSPKQTRIEDSPGEDAGDPHEEETDGDWKDQAVELVSKLAIESAPPWAVSMIVHLVVLIVLALIVFQPAVSSRFIVEVSTDQELGEQLLDDSQFMETIEPLDVLPAVSYDEKPVDDPFAATPNMEVKLELFESPTDLSAPSVGIALSGREQGAKRALLAAYGGTGETENSVQLALEWLKRNQHSDGSWSLTGPYANGVLGSENRLAATAMALLALQGAGNTHTSGEFTIAVKKAKDALLRMQDRDGSFITKQNLQNQHQLYSQGQATIAICELYGMTKDEELREPAQRALDYAVSIQADSSSGGGGWRYNPRSGVDTSVTGWFVMALQSGKMSQLNVSDAALNKVSLFLDSVSDDGIEYRYRPGDKLLISMTAEALLCRQYLGWERDDARLLAGVRLINENPIDYDPPDITQTPSVYYWYYATQVMHHMGGEPWHEWNKTMRKALPAAQVKTGKERGSWSPSGDRFGAQGGRLYTTCFCVYMLEVYYRHMPIYRH